MNQEKTATYAVHASDQFNRWMDEVMHRLSKDISQALGDNLVALILGGGYGRGEGGVVNIAGVERPYNDLDFTLLVKEKRAIDWNAIHRIRHTYEGEIHIDVDFSRPLTLNDVKHLPPWLMWYDLLNGHMVLVGGEDILTANVPPLLKQPPPAIEATRLLLNRGAGLLWAIRVLRRMESSPDKDFVRRNYFKCALSIGDALLIAYRRFTTAYRGRDERLAQLMRDSAVVLSFDILTLYKDALEFKFSPDEFHYVVLTDDHLKALAFQWGELFLHVERLRTGRPFPTIDEYIEWGGLREPEQHTAAKWLRNVVRSFQHRSWSFRYPRERLYRQLPHLLGLTAEPPCDWRTESARFLEVWREFN